MKGGDFMSSELIMLKKRAGYDLEETEITDDNIPGTELGKHLCWSCSNGYPSKCEKIANIVKGTIDTYDFIKSGYQIIRDNDIERFIVTSCLNYEKAIDQPNCSGQEFREEVGKLFTNYYGTNTVDEALAKFIARNQNKIIEKARTKTLY